MRFIELEVSAGLREKARKMGLEELTAIQEKSIPLILEGKDVSGQAETGSGKTIAFSLPIMDKLEPRKGIQAVVLTPTRELCVQVTDVMRDFAGPDIRVASVYGGVAIGPQTDEIRTADVVVATPGRMLDHIGRKTIFLKNVRFLVLDEADKMFEMGFVEDVEEIISHLPKDRQTLMFSATVTYDVHSIMKRHMKDPVMLETKPLVDPTKLKQQYLEIHEQRDKFPILVHLLKHDTAGLAIVFCATRSESDIIARNLKANGVNAKAIHGGMTQNMREDSLEALKKENIDVLVATDVAARGLDIKNVTHVYNYDVPKTPKEYIHRIGRTARAGEAGDAITLLTPRDYDNFRNVLSDITLNIRKGEPPRFQRVPFRRYSDSGPPRGRRPGQSRGYRGSERSGPRGGHGGRRPSGPRRDRGPGSRPGQTRERRDRARRRPHRRGSERRSSGRRGMHS